MCGCLIQPLSALAPAKPRSSVCASWLNALAPENGHAGKIPEMRTTKTLEALQVAVEHDLLELGDAEGLAEAWRFASRARNATVQVRGKASDQLPRDARERAAVAAILQYQPGQSDEMVNNYLRAARRARGIVDRIFWS